MPRRLVNVGHGPARSGLADGGPDLAVVGIGYAGAMMRGHFYGGLLGLFALARGIAGFGEIHAASPSLWWGDGMIEAPLETCRVDSARSQS